jgi:hypothetical protein
LYILVLEERINTTVVVGIEELKNIVSASSSSEPAANTTDWTNDVLSQADWALDAVNMFFDNVDNIQRRANRVTFAMIEDYAKKYGFFRSATWV